MEQNPREANSRSASQEISHLLRYLKVHYCILNHLNLVNTHHPSVWSV